MKPDPGTNCICSWIHTLHKFFPLAAIFVNNPYGVWPIRTDRGLFLASALLVILSTHKITYQKWFNNALARNGNLQELVTCQ